MSTLNIHHGRHTFISHALAGGRTLAEVRAAAGHANLVTTSLYLHIAVADAVMQSLKGISHNKIEDTLPEHLELSVRALDRLAEWTLAWLIQE